MKLARAWKKTGFIFYQLTCNLASYLGAAENFVMDPVEAEQNSRCSLRNTKACVRRRENGEQARRQTRNASLRSRRNDDSLRLRKQQESTEQLEQQRQAR